MDGATAAPVPFELGNLRAYILNDGIFGLDGGSVFGRVPRVLWEKVAAPDHLNRVPLSLNSILLESDGKLVLIEVGYGDKLTAKQEQIFGLVRPQGNLLHQLGQIGVQPDDIAIVVNTHLHGDHSGWNTRYPSGDTSAQPVPTFANARYVVQRLEWEEATHPNELTTPAYPAQNFVPLREHGVLDLVEGEVQLTSNLRLVPTPGHTAGHQSVWLTAGDTTALFTGDAAVHSTHLERLNWVGAVDNLPVVSVETKRQLVATILKSGASVIITHHPYPGLGMLVLPEGDRRPVFISGASMSGSANV